VIALIEDGALDTLLAQVGGDTELRQRFLRDFVRLWDSRAERLGRSLAAQDLQEAHVVLLSIRSSSEMVGAVVVEATAALVHGALTQGDLDGCLRHLPRLLEVGESTCRELAVLAAAADRADAERAGSPVRRWQHPREP
jgi:HPt (histidine-containing phosphotransfer) domain-containing protein